VSASWTARPIRVFWLIAAALPALCTQQPPGSKQIERDIAEGKTERSIGHFAEAVQLFVRAAHAAHTIGNLELEAKALGSAGACQIRLFQYRAALESSAAARDIALRAKDNSLAGLAAVNVSLIYAQLGDFSQAQEEARASVRLLQQSSRKDILTRALLNYGSIQVNQGDTKAGVESYHEAILTAQKAKLTEEEGFAWDALGRSYLDMGELGKAEWALAKAHDLDIATHDRDSLAPTTTNQAELEYKKNDFAASLKLLDAAFASRSSLFSTAPRYEPVHLRGEILLALGRNLEALAEFGKAVELADAWRHGALPGDATSTRTSSHLHNVYEDYVETAAQLGLQHKDTGLVRQAWEVLAESRAAGLREQMSLALDRDGRLPPRYFELLSNLQRVQAQLMLQRNAIEEAKAQQIRRELSSLKNQIGIEAKDYAQPDEKIFHKKSLRNIQLRLTMSELLLSFGLGQAKSFLWTITRDRVNVYELPAEAELGKQVRAFSRAVQNSGDASSASRSLSRQLFGKLTTDAWQKPDWLIAADGVLLSGVPFAALPHIPFSAPDLPLIASHTLRFLPSELLLTAPRGPVPEPRFLGVADPIYNLADSRRLRRPTLLQTAHADDQLPLARLAGSDGEIRTAAKLSRMPEVELLEGSSASIAALRTALTKRPQVLHFAVHVVSPKGRPDEAALALSLTADNVPELLTREAIAEFRVPGSLVILDGCSSQQGETVPGAGLIGLSRAWLLAGASAVIVSAWPTPDDSGRFFSSFYSHFQPIASAPGPVAKRAAVALQRAQLAMRRSSGYGSSPSSWAAYSVISKE
jgi:CHAT domain-containing protein/predicted negative regulator of RcsB-dependent stress response